MRCSDGHVYSLNYHLVRCPKYWRPVLAGIVADRLNELLATKAREIDVIQLMPDQVHLFVDSHPGRRPSHLAHQFKRFTSRMLCHEFASLGSRLATLWSHSYFVGRGGAVSEATVRRGR